MIIINFKNLTVSGLMVIYLASINVVRAEDAPAAQEVIQPAPPGPYISSALLDNEIDTPATETLPAELPPAADSPVVVPVPPDNDKVLDTKPAVRVDRTKMPMEAFSPDIPWPADLRPPNSQSSGSWVTNQMMPGYDSRQVIPDNRRQYSGQQQNRSSYYRAPVTNDAAYSRRLNLPQSANQQMQKIPNTGLPGFKYQMPNTYVPQNNFSTGYPAGSMLDPYYFKPGYTN
jgi:hypothetical protein